MTSVRKLAELAGVSPMTVSRVLNNRPNVRPELRARILELAQLYHCRSIAPTSSATAGNGSGVIGCLVTDTSHFYYSHLLKGVLEQAYADSYHVIVLQTFNQSSRLTLAIDALVKQRVDGIIIGPSSHVITKSTILNLRSHGIAMVGMGVTLTESPIDVVHADENRIGELMVEHLWELGHRKIAYLGPISDASSSMRGFSVISTLERRGLSLCGLYEVKDFSIGSAVRCLLDTEHPPTAVIAYSDFYAVQFIQQIERRGFRVPKDLSVISSANIAPWTDSLSPALTSVDEHPEELGHRAFSVLFNALSQGAYAQSRPPETILVPPTLVVRESCGSPRKHSLTSRK